MVKGRPPKPAGLRLLEGTDKRGHSGRMLDRTREPIAPDDELLPPFDLAPEVQRIWDETKLDLERMRVASSADRWVVVGYCVYAALFERVGRELVGQDLVVDGSRSPVISKRVAVQEKAAAMLLKFATELGLSPVARNRVTTTQISGSTGYNPFAPDSDFFKG